MPLLDPRALDASQATLYEEAVRTITPMGAKAGYVTKTADGRLVGPFDSMCSVPRLALRFSRCKGQSARTPA